MARSGSPPIRISTRTSSPASSPSVTFRPKAARPAPAAVSSSRPGSTGTWRTPGSNASSRAAIRDAAATEPTTISAPPGAAGQRDGRRPLAGRRCGQRMGKPGASDEERGWTGRQPRFRDAGKVVLGPRVADGDDVAPGGEFREDRPQRFGPAPDRRERHLLRCYADVGEYFGEIGVRVAVIAPPDFRFFQGLAAHENVALFGRPAGRGEGGRQDPERRARAGTQSFDRRDRFGGGLAAQRRVDLLEEDAVTVEQRGKRRAMLVGCLGCGQATAVGVIGEHRRPLPCRTPAEGRPSRPPMPFLAGRMLSRNRRRRSGRRPGSASGQAHLSPHVPAASAWDGSAATQGADPSHIRSAP